MTDIFTKEKRSEIMSKIRGKWTRQERKFYEQNTKAIPHPEFPYHPDFLLNGKFIFLDSSFWHGHIPQRTYDNMNGYWQGKLFRNIVRDECAIAFYGFLEVLDRRMEK